MFPFTTCSNMGTLFAHPELIWVLSLCKYSTNCPRPSETIYSYHKAWEPSVPNGVICIVNGNALLVCSIWLCTGAVMGGLVNRFSPAKLTRCSVDAFSRATAPSSGLEQNSETENSLKRTLQTHAAVTVGKRSWLFCYKTHTFCSVVL